MIKDNRNKQGFTLIELLVTVILIGVIASIGIPRFATVKEKAMDREAIIALQLVRTAERQYFMKNNHYYPYAGSQTLVSSINAMLSLDLVGTNWGYQITGASGASFTARATRAPRTWTLTQAPGDPVCTPLASCF